MPWFTRWRGEPPVQRGAEQFLPADATVDDDDMPPIPSNLAGRPHPYVVRAPNTMGSPGTTNLCQVCGYPKNDGRGLHSGVLTIPEELETRYRPWPGLDPAITCIDCLHPVAAHGHRPSMPGDRKCTIGSCGCTEHGDALRRLAEAGPPPPVCRQCWLWEDLLTNLCHCGHPLSQHVRQHPHGCVRACDCDAFDPTNAGGPYEGLDFNTNREARLHVDLAGLVSVIDRMYPQEGPDTIANLDLRVKLLSARKELALDWGAPLPPAPEWGIVSPAGNGANDHAVFKRELGVEFGDVPPAESVETVLVFGQAAPLGPMLGDGVFVLSLLVHSFAEAHPGLLDDASIDHHLGGPTSATLEFEDDTYRLTIEAIH